MSDHGRGGASSMQGNPQSAVTKAQKFEDEKRRIISACFSKVDADGSLLESYITHCKIIEDAAYPSSPPPADSSLDQKKPRHILVAVRKSGRVRMHKARENANGSFSIGKTWNLDDLQQIENFPPPNERGFIITIVKPYFWQANSLKEKEFFLQSILKIYKKYTGGKVPVLVGFEGTEIGRIAEGAAVITSGTVNARTQSPSSTAGSQHSSRNLLSQQPLRNQQSSPSIRARDDGLNAPSSSSLRSMQSAVSLSQSRGQDSQTNSSFLDTQGVPGNVRRRPSDTSSTRSGMSVSNARTDRAPSASSGPSQPLSEDQGTEKSNSIKKQASFSETQSPSTSISLHVKAPEQNVSFSRKVDVSVSKPPVLQEQPTPGKKKSGKDIANTFKLAAASYTAAGLLGKKPGTPTGSSPTIRSPLSAFPGINGSTLKDKISGPIIEQTPRSDREAGVSLDNPSPSPNFLSNTPPSTISAAPLSSDHKNQVSLKPPKEPRDGRRSPEQLSLSTSDEVRRRRSPSPGLQARKRLSHSFMDDIDTSTLNVNIADVLKEFNWDWRGKVEGLEMDIKRELTAVEAKNVLINPAEDERLEELGRLMDKAIDECEKMDGLLTLYAVELTSLTDDIAHIENQSQGLQVQTVNQKILQKELETILSTVSISSSQLSALKQGSLENSLGLEQIEFALLSLYRAMQTIDPTIGRTSFENALYHDQDDENIGSIRALQERKEVYQQDCKAFLGRLRQFMNIKFQAEMVDMQKIIRESNVTGQAGRTLAKPKLLGHDQAYQKFYRFSGLLLFAKEVDKDGFMELQRLYERPVRGVYQEELRDYIFAWKRISRKPTTEEMECVFTAAEKDSDRLTTTVRTLTVKKSQTLGKIRSPISESFSSGVKGLKDAQEGKLYPHEAFSGALNDIFRIVCREQNFIMEFFHLSTKDAISFADYVATGTPDQRQLRDLGAMRTIDPDRMVGRMLVEYMGEIFSFLLTDLGNLIEWAVKSDPIQGVGILYTLEEKFEQTEQTNQEFMIKTMQKLHDRFSGLFDKFLEEQIRAIEDTKLKVKKRKGIIPFMRIFPPFCARIEDQLPPLPPQGSASEVSRVRQMVNVGYDRINKAMFESIQAIAKESPISSHSGATGAGTVHAVADPEDKEQLNYHIMMIENMNYYVEEVETKGNVVLAEFMNRAEMEYREHMGLYVGAAVRRPLGKLLDFIESLDAILKPGTQTIEEVSTRMASHSKPVLKKILSHYDSKEVRRGIETLRKRVDKHFSPDDEKGAEAAHARRLLSKIAKELMDEYLKVMERLKELVTMGAYQGLEVEFTREDIVHGFTK